MEFIAVAVLLVVGALLIVADFTIYNLYRQGDTLIMGTKVLAAATFLTVAYFVSIAVLVL